MRYTGSPSSVDPLSPGNLSLASTEHGEEEIAVSLAGSPARTPTPKKQRTLSAQQTVSYSPGGEYKCVYDAVSGAALQICSHNGVEIGKNISRSAKSGFVAFVFSDGHEWRSEVPAVTHQLEFPELWGEVEVYRRPAGATLKKPVSKIPLGKSPAKKSSAKKRKSSAKSSAYKNLYSKIYHRTRTNEEEKGKSIEVAKKVAREAAQKASAHLKQR